MTFLQEVFGFVVRLFGGFDLAQPLVLLLQLGSLGRPATIATKNNNYEELFCLIATHLFFLDSSSLSNLSSVRSISSFLFLSTTRL